MNRSKQQTHVHATESKGIRQRILHIPFDRLLRNEIKPEVNVRFLQIEGGRQYSLFQSISADRRLQSSRCSQKMPSRALASISGCTLTFVDDTQGREERLPNTL